MQVEWDASKDKALWKILSKASKNSDIDCKFLVKYVLVFYANGRRGCAVGIDYAITKIQLTQKIERRNLK